MFASVAPACFEFHSLTLSVRSSKSLHHIFKVYFLHACSSMTSVVIVFLSNVFPSTSYRSQTVHICSALITNMVVGL
ncbi:hypothetical protein BDR03DRAFT_965201 [Suillus americanus]|nr:hypothetical protein BDR03DRAFT_965201 [Suillus americanus]